MGHLPPFQRSPEFDFTGLLYMVATVDWNSHLGKLHFENTSTDKELLPVLLNQRSLYKSTESASQYTGQQGGCKCTILRQPFLVLWAQTEYQSCCIG